MHSEVNLLSVDNETVHPCWIRCNDTGSSDILPTTYKIQDLLYNQATDKGNCDGMGCVISPIFRT